MVYVQGLLYVLIYNGRRWTKKSLFAIQCSIFIGSLRRARLRARQLQL